jgi:hypothetical protein
VTDPRSIAARDPQRPTSAPVRPAIAAVPNEVTPQFVLVRRRRPGTQPADYPEGALRKGGREARLNDHAVRQLAGVTERMPPPARLAVRLFVDVERRMIGFQRADDPNDPEARQLIKEKKEPGSTSFTWRIRLTGAIPSGDVPEKSVPRRVRAFGNRIFGFHYGPEEGDR